MKRIVYIISTLVIFVLFTSCNNIDSNEIYNNTGKVKRLSSDNIVVNANAHVIEKMQVLGDLQAIRPIAIGAFLHIAQDGRKTLVMFGCENVEIVSCTVFFFSVSGLICESIVPVHEYSKNCFIAYQSVEEHPLSYFGNEFIHNYENGERVIDIPTEVPLAFVFNTNDGLPSNVIPVVRLPQTKGIR